MRRYLPFVIVGSVALLDVGAGAMLYRAKRPAVISVSPRTTTDRPNSGSEHSRGAANAPVTLEEFGDFECPPCAALSDPINQLEEEYRGRLRLVFRHHPLTLHHHHAQDAAQAAEAAGAQGKFWEMHDLLYREQLVWSKSDDARTLFSSYAGMLGLDLARFKADLDSEQIKARVAADDQLATKLGITNTPTLIINNRTVAPTALNPPALRAAIEETLKSLGKGADPIK